MIEATPDAARQVEMIQAVDPKFMRTEGNPINALLLTHADIGHYTGLVQFRPEVTTIRQLPVYCTEIMASFLSNNEPWKLMVQHQIIDLRRFSFQQTVSLDEGVRFEAVKIPHDKSSDMAGFRILGPDRSLLFIPDIDQWEDRFLEIVDSVDYAFVDATFYSERKGSKIHPLIKDSMAFFKDIAGRRKTKVYFIHFNHNNVLLSGDRAIRTKIEAAGFYMADDGHEIWL
jgi:pyrroloquinoline quinone biosynthesis protein B